MNLMYGILYMGKILQFDALLSVAPPMKEPRAKDWRHFIVQGVCFKFVVCWAVILHSLGEIHSAEVYPFLSEQLPVVSAKACCLPFDSGECKHG